MNLDRRFVLVAGLCVAASARAQPAAEAPPLDFDTWRAAFIDRATPRFGRAVVERELAGLTADPRVVALDGRQPELTRPIGDYLSATVSATRVQEARTKRAGAATWLDPIAARYGVPAEVLTAVWGVESSFGVIQGDFDVVRSLATLAANGRRRSFAEDQLMAALKIITSGEVTRDQLKGSWAGAMGQTQFTPDDYLRWGVDADGDGRRDIWRSSPDALGSAANFLSRKADWRRGEPWQVEVILPAGFDYGLSEGAAEPLSAWRARGVQLSASLHPSYRPAESAPAALILPQGWNGPAFLTFANHKAIKAYNNSTSYALAVGLLADRIAGAEPLARAWPADKPLTLADRLAAQQALVRMGYDVGGPPDGVIGTNTRKAVRLWQAKVGLPADGYLSFALAQRLKDAN